MPGAAGEHPAIATVTVGAEEVRVDDRDGKDLPAARCAHSRRRSSAKAV